jgi:hypothetical protein
MPAAGDTAVADGSRRARRSYCGTGDYALALDTDTRVDPGSAVVSRTVRRANNAQNEIAVKMIIF